MHPGAVVGSCLLLAVVTLSGCSSTTSSTAAVQDDAVASTAATIETSVAAQDSPSPSPVDSMSPDATSEPTSDPGATAPAVASGDSCESGLAYACGETGPGGGTVFYAVSSPFPCGPKGSSSTCNFLEAAANPWDPSSEHACPNTPCGGTVQVTSDFSFSGKGISWCTGLGPNDYVSNTYDSIGSGFQNTAYMNTMCGSGSASQAAGNYQGGGLTDWYLPSKDELNALYAYPNRAAIGGFNSGKYWSSSAGYPLGQAWLQSFANGAQDSVQAKGNTFGVRPIRAF